MSHYAVLVIGDDVEKQLAPYDENIVVDEFVEGVVSQKEKESFIDYYKKDLIGKTIGNSEKIEGVVISDDATESRIENHVLFTSFELLYELKGEAWNGGRWRKGDDGEWYSYSTYNPDSKWDWYEVGGRWAGYFKPKPSAVRVVEPSFSWGWPEEEKQKIYESGRVDGGRKGDLDLEGMREDAVRNASERYDQYEQAIANTPQHENWKDLATEIGTRFKSMDEVRKFYHAQPRIKAFKESGPGGFLSNIEDYEVPREQYIELARLNAVIPYAYLYKGVWYGRGEMGWFGMDKSKVADETAWLIKANETIALLHDDVMLTIVDCHI